MKRWMWICGVAWMVATMGAVVGCADEDAGAGVASGTADGGADDAVGGGSDDGSSGGDGADVDGDGADPGADGSVTDAPDGGGDSPIESEALGWPGWDNATVYFVITDRFFDGNPSNNGSYGRQADGADEVGTFHGGDLAGLTVKLEEGYFSALGVSALWITAPYEQVHGWVVGGGGGFRHYAYHGYFALDFTRLDANMGTPAELEEFVDAAHEQEIRVIFDVVMNHPGYATAQDLVEYGVDVVTDGWQDATIANYYDFIDFESPNFAAWWGPQWIRADLGGGYSSPGNDSLTRTVTFLPDFKTESPVTGISLPPFYANKPDTLAVAREGYRVRDYLIEWLTQWVEQYGIDGFRCDTAKHVEQAAWKELKEAAHAALRNWRTAHAAKAFPDSDYADPERPFWMTGEVYPHGVTKDAYYDNGFDSLINFDFQGAAGGALSDPASIDAIWSTYAASINTDPSFNALSYLSSHDTSLFFDKHAQGDLAKQKLAGTLLLLTPGAVQIFYGDENARPKGPDGGDATQGTRSDYVWGGHPDVLLHWQRVGLFRKKHPAVGAGSHQQVASAPYAFRRAKDSDVVYAAMGAGQVELDVSADFVDGTRLRDAYSGAEASVVNGKVQFFAATEGLVLIEPAE